MAALNLKDLPSVLTAYQSIISGRLTWFMLQYTNNDEELFLTAQGLKDLEELKTEVYDAGRVFIAFYHEFGQDSPPGYFLINYIPLSSISVVSRARILAHSRRVASMFKVDYKVVTIEHLSQLSSTTIHQTISESASSPSIAMGRSISQATEWSRKVAPKHNTQDVIRRSFSETYAPHVVLSQTSVPEPKSTSVFSGLLRKKKKPDGPISIELYDNPPPIPPKDDAAVSQHRSHQRNLSSQADIPVLTNLLARSELDQRQSDDISDFAVISHAYDDDVPELELGSPQPPQKDIHSIDRYSMPLQGKWAPAKRAILTTDPAERERRREGLRRQKQREEEEALREEQTRKADLKRQKEDLLRQERFEEEQRRATLEEELSRIKLQRKRKEELEREEEEQRMREIEEKKRLDRVRRMEEHKKLDEWRRQQAAIIEEASRRAQQEKRQGEAERENQIKLVEAKIRREIGAESPLTGWVTLQTQESPVWKRRFYRFVENTLFLQRAPKDTCNALEGINLRGQVSNLREWNEGYEYLEAIPFSFAVEFKDGRGAWSMYSDSEGEKFQLLGLLYYAAGLSGLA